MNLHFKTYSATGNIIGVAYYSDIFDIQDFVDNLKERRHLKSIALKNHCDSVMVLIKNSLSRLETIVFEPNNDDEHGAFSVMCGNGVRAVADYAATHLHYLSWPISLQTRSGILKVEKLSNNTYKVGMGNIVTRRSVLRPYIDSRFFSKKSYLQDVAIPPVLLKKLRTLNFGNNGAVCSIGFSTTETDIHKMNGEPHLMIELKKQSVSHINELRKIAQHYGPFICENKNIFPLGINVNFVVPDQRNKNSFLVCTFERNLGDDPEKSVTNACGTGCTFIGIEQMRKLKTRKIVAECLGGRLTIEKKNDFTYMSGDVIEL